MISLVSVIISTYNSSPFIIETLESVVNQKWKELELIITDDCSTDNTIDLCLNWMKKYEKRFARIELLTIEKNSGVSANANRGLRVAQGEWIKFLGADDTLESTCIEDNMSWISSHQDIRILFSRVDIYSDLFVPENLINTTEDDSSNPNSIMAPERHAGSQYRMLLVNDRIHYSPSLFLHAQTLRSVGGFDERFRLLEDYPLWLNLTKNGHKLYMMNKVTVNYRQHKKAINNTGIGHILDPKYFKEEDFRNVYIYPNLPIDIMLLQRFNWYTTQIFHWSWLNRKNRTNEILFSLCTSILNPFKYLVWIRKKLNKDPDVSEFYT